MATKNNSLDAQAAHWQLRRSEVDFTAEDEAAFQNWIGSDPVRAVAFARVSRTWDLMEGLKDNLTAEAADADFHLSRRALAAALIGAIGSGALWYALDRSDRYTTAVGEHRTVRLADGSSIDINTDSAVEIRLGHTVRAVSLVRGEAVFHVAKDRKRPWKVSVAGAHIEAIGTVFAVRTNGAETSVMMLEGLVRITNSTRDDVQAYVPAGNMASINRSTVRVVKARPDEVERMLSWREGVLEFNGQTVWQIAEEFNRYSQSKIVVIDPETANLRFGGRFATREAKQFLDALCANFPVRAINGEDGNIYLTARPKADVAVATG